MARNNWFSPFSSPLPSIVDSSDNSSEDDGWPRDSEAPIPGGQGPVLSDRYHCLSLDEAEPEPGKESRAGSLCNGFNESLVRTGPRAQYLVYPERERWRCALQEHPDSAPLNRAFPAFPPGPTGSQPTRGAPGLCLPEPLGLAQGAGNPAGERGRGFPITTRPGGQPPHHLLEPGVVL